MQTLKLLLSPLPPPSSAAFPLSRAPSLPHPTPRAATLQFNVDLPSLVVGLMIKDRLGHEMFGINSHRLSIPIENLAAGSEHVFRLRFQMDLGEGHYSVTTALTRSDAHVDRTYEWRDRALIFYAINVDKPRFVGCNWLAPQASLECIDAREQVSP